ncbi:hypothetical protein AMATHDRAFT_196740 [Amanita thiersii Skay4041]|uniref:Protein kinase domain-containing protein n=1 Tax=Amanita thiersii Skay4041 TaxID=703135 RepID=A0A2A9NKV5_9AGAR|nr:hypothetical protein AMATHDRAFT_196740 [Amanita thiersii Skay4041]
MSKASSSSSSTKEDELKKLEERLRRGLRPTALGNEFKRNPPLTVKDLQLRVILQNADPKRRIPSILSHSQLDASPAYHARYHSKDTHRRLVWLQWPRNPNGLTLLPQLTRPGKMAGNELQLWGSTLLSFYFVYRSPGMMHLMTRSSATKLSAFTSAHDEVQFAQTELQWARREPDPHRIEPYSVAELIRDQELRIRMGLCGTTGRPGDELTDDPVEGKDESEGHSQNDETRDENENVTKEKSPNKVEDVFRADAYPAPWPMVPFSYRAPKLQKRLPLYMLPKKLVVHDPWDLLAVHSSRFYEGLRDEADWTTMEDITHVYNLTLSAAGQERMKEQKRHDAEHILLERKKKRKGLIIPDVDKLEEPYDGFVVPPMTDDFHTPVEPPIYVIHDPPPEPKSPEVAHLYIDPGLISGWGNHSMVLYAELEVSRSLLVPDILCYECVMEDVRKTIIALDGEDGSRKSKQWKTKSGVWRAAEGRQPTLWMHSMFPEDGDVESYMSRPNPPHWRYVGPVRPIRTSVGWQNLERGPYCEHVASRLSVEKGKEQSDTSSTPALHPLTAKVSVVAKLSKQQDLHLEREASNYQIFPEHLFEHWSGYNLVEPLHHPVPIGPILPQFYGYYTPDKGENKRSYRSPILLMEYCGRQIEREIMRVDDKAECASLFYRLHHAGYLHHSTWERNILVQEGPLDLPPVLRGTEEFTEDGRELSFRLIDFGRSVEIDKPLSRAEEEWEVTKLTGTSIEFVD